MRPVQSQGASEAMKDAPPEKRSTLRRQINSLGMRGGEFEESKWWAQVGKGLCVWLIYKHGEVLVSHENTLFVLLLFIIMPELIKKFLTMRYGNGMTGGSVERTEHRESVNITSSTAKAPPSKEPTIP